MADDDKVGHTSNEVNESAGVGTGATEATPVGNTVNTAGEDAGAKVDDAPPVGNTAESVSQAKAAEEAAEAEEAEEEEEEPAEEEEEEAAPAGPKYEYNPLTADELAAAMGEPSATAPYEPSASPDPLAGINQTQSEWAGMVGTAEGAINSALTTAGNAIASITSFLAPVPAMLLIFPSSKIPIPIPIPVMYKPETLTFSKEAGWSDDHKKNKEKRIRKDGTKMPMHDVPQVYYGGGGPEILEFELFFDTTDTQMDVRLHTKPIQMLVYRVPFLQQPPLVMFSWGMMLSKMSYIEDIEIKYEMFRADGTPLRATIDMTLTEYDMGFLSLLPMNPTSYSEARKTWRVVEGQTLDWIAYQEYGDPAQWRHIAKVNNLDNPRDLRPGQILKLTPLA